MATDEEIRNSIRRRNLIGNGGAGRVYAVDDSLVVKIFYLSRNRTLEKDAKYELRIGNWEGIMG